MEPRSKLVSLLLVVTYLHLKAGNSELIVFPRDTEVVFNQSTYFNCSTSIVSATIHWNHYRVGENITNYVYYKRQFNKLYSDRYSIAINNRTGRYDLIIRSVQPGDAGRYECRDFEGLGIHRSAELIVLDFLPKCQSNMKPDGFVVTNLPGDELQLSCSISYSGNIPPTLQWKMEGSDTPISKGIVVDNFVKTVIVNLTKRLDIKLHNASFTCSATRSQNGQATCTTDQVQVNSVAEETTKELLLLILIPIVAVLLISSIILFFKMRKDKYRKNSALKVNNSEDNQGNRVTDEANKVNKEENDKGTPPTHRFEEQLLLEEHPVTATAGKEKNHGNRPNERNTRVGPRIRFHTLPSQDDNDAIRTCKKKVVKTRASMATGSAITGVAILEDLLYLVSDKSSEVETFNSKGFEFKKRYKLKELESPWDMVSCKLNKCLYIMDRRSTGKSNHILRVDSDVEVLLLWLTGEVYGNLSVTSEGHIIITFCDSRRLVMYEPDGKMLYDVPLSKDIIHPTHALKLSSGQLLISYGLDKDNVRRVCVLDESGEIIKNSFERMESPGYLAVDKNGIVFVADQGNNRVCALNSDLELIEEVTLRKDGLRSPQKVCLDEKRRNLFVVDNEVLERSSTTCKYGSLTILSYTYEL